jgi:hypothetical protein
MKKLFAFVTDGEGIVAAMTMHGWTPLVTVHERLLPGMREMALDVARESGKTIRLLEFSDPKELEVFGP